MCCLSDCQELGEGSYAEQRVQRTDCARSEWEDFYVRILQARGESFHASFTAWFGFATSLMWCKSFLRLIWAAGTRPRCRYRHALCGAPSCDEGGKVAPHSIVARCFVSLLRADRQNNIPAGGFLWRPSRETEPDSRCHRAPSSAGCPRASDEVQVLRHFH